MRKQVLFPALPVTRPISRNQVLYNFRLALPDSDLLKTWSIEQVLHPLPCSLGASWLHHGLADLSFSVSPLGAHLEENNLSY